MVKLKIRPLRPEDWEQITKLSDKNFGSGYITKEDLSQFFGPKRQNNAICSFVLEGSDGKIYGMRISFAPGLWPEELLSKSMVDHWDYSKNEVAYFKTILVDSELQGQGWGPKLTEASIKELQKLGAKAVVCHSWKESPNNSSQRYLIKMDFEPIGEIKNFWQNKDYSCIGCQSQPCICTATEMIKKLKEPAA